MNLEDTSDSPCLVSADRYSDVVELYRQLHYGMSLDQ